jgi:hypothetical protein
MNIPFYSFRSMGKMVDRVQSQSMAMDTSVFHSWLIKMLVMEELKKRNLTWEHIHTYKKRNLTWEHIHTYKSIFDFQGETNIN